MIKGQTFLLANENKKKAKPEIFRAQYWSHGFSLVERQMLLKLDWNRLNIYSPERIFEIINTVFLTSQLEINRT